MSTIPKARNNFSEEELQAAKEVRDFLIAENEPRLKSIYMAGEIVMWDEMRQLATDGREELEEMAKEVLRIAKERDRLKMVIENIEKEYQNIYKALDELAIQYELSAENKFKELGIPLNEEYLPTLFKAKEILNKTETSGELFKKIIKD